MDNRTEQNAKSSKLQEVANKTLDALDDIKSSIENSGTIISCIVEFNSMQQAINQYQDSLAASSNKDLLSNE